MSNKNDNMNIDLLKKYASNQCTSKEIDQLFTWLRDYSNDEEKEEIIKNYWNELNSQEAGDKLDDGRRLDRIHHSINLSRSAKNSSIDNLRVFEPKRKSLLGLFSRVAAILLIPVISILMYTQFLQPYFEPDNAGSSMNEIIAPPGSRTFLELSDGSKVWLNANSKMKYPQRFSGETRIVQLEGEGYFEVAHNKKIPFIVKTSGMQVKAVGTSFNVKAYQADHIETMLTSGKVIIMNEQLKKKTTVCEMTPGQLCIYNPASNHFALQQVNHTKYTSWKDGKLVFDDDKIERVAELLSRWYNVNIMIEDTELLELTYTATFVDEPLSQVLEMLGNISPIDYKFSDRQKQADGTFSKSEISIYKKKEKQTN